MTTNPNGKGSEDNSYTVEGSIPSVVTLPSEAAQQLAQQIFNEFGVSHHSLFGEYLGQVIECQDKDTLAKVIQEYWDSLV